MNSQDIVKELHVQLGIPVVEKSNFWLIRTESGLYYDDFYANSFVGIGWDYASVHSIRYGTFDDLKKLIENNEHPKYKNEKARKSEYTSIANKLIRFVEEIRAGDIVIIPSESSAKISIGEIVDDEVYEDTRFSNKFANDSVNICPFIKRRKVRWIKQQFKDEIDVYLFKLLSCHQAIYSANEYAEFISRTIYPVYISDNKLHATFKAGHINGLSVDELVDLVGFINLLTQGADKNSVEVKLNIHSPGIIEIVSLVLASGVTISLVIFALNHFINGGKTNVSFKTKNMDLKINAESKGLLDHHLEKDEFELKKEVVEQYQQLHESIQLNIPEMDTDIKQDQGK